MLRIWIRMLLDLLDSDPLVRAQRRESGSGSGSFKHQAKIGRKPLIPTVLRLLYGFLSLGNDVNVPSKSNKQKLKPIVFCWCLEGQWRKWQDSDPLEARICGSGSVPKTDPQHCFIHFKICLCDTGKHTLPLTPKTSIPGELPVISGKSFLVKLSLKLFA